MNRALRLTAAVAIVASGFLVGLLHLTSDLDPIERRLSEYATGDLGPVMVTAFLLAGVGLVACGLLFGRRKAWIPGLALIGAGIGMVVSGIFPTDPGAETTMEAVHSNASALATVLVVGAALWWSFIDRRAGRLSSILAVAGFALVIASVLLHDSTVSGLSQRVLWLVLLSWVIVVVVEPADGGPDGG